MKPAILLAFLFILLISACQPGGKKASLDETSQCFVYKTAKDTVSLSLVLDGEKATGLLTYRFYEKDTNKGTINGILKGDTLVADYTFRSEGIESVRQVIFLKTEDGLLEGFGESVETPEKTVFKDPGSLKFSEGLKLKKTDCLD